MIVKIDLRLVLAALAVIIVSALAVVYQQRSQSSETISVTGTASLKAAPDEFIFSLSYQEEAATGSAAIDAVSKKGNAVVAKLTELGAETAKMKTSVSTDAGYPLYGRTEGTVGALYQITLTINDSAIAQKVLDYAVTTDPLYGVSPTSTLSQATRQRLETEARSAALRDAKTKANQTAEDLGVRLGRLSSISEPVWGGPIPIMAEGQATTSKDVAEPVTAPVLLVGEETVSYSVQVSYRFR